MVQISEANISSAMKFAFEEFIKPLDKEGILDYRPKNQKDEDWLRDNKASGLIYLKKHPTAKVAWVIVRFESRTDKVYGQHTITKENRKITTPQEFQDFFGVAPGPDFSWPEDLTIYARWDKEKVANKYANRDYDETTPNFYMYTNHLEVNLDKLIKRLYRIDEIINTDPKAIQGNVFNIPYSATNIK